MVEGVVNPAGSAPTTRPLVSVIIPAHNAAEYLAETVSSALGQTYEPLEVIVVNDGSTDDTGAIAAQLGDGIQYIEQANAGPAAARNAGLRARRAHRTPRRRRSLATEPVGALRRDPRAASGDRDGHH
jgi:cellulose synthase/poly-beta-1,6-N-acetylglucosamine synthase-like glycosyltransferase